MIILGLDFGLAKIGVAIAVGPLAEPLKVIRYDEEEVLIGQIQRLVRDEKVEKFVVGISEGESAELAHAFGVSLQDKTGLPVEFEDETLSTEDVQALALEAGIRRKKRHEMEDAYAATLILQNYLDR